MLTATVTDWVSTANDSSASDGRAAAPVDVDQALARSAAGGDSTAFEALYRRHASRIHGVVARLVGYDRARAEDLVQEAFVRAWQALPAYRFESAFGTWLHRLAVNTALMDLRAARSRPRGSDDEDALDQVGAPDSAGQSTALTLDLERAVATLPPRARAVLVLYDVEGWKHEEIAGALGMAVGSSKAQLHRARGLLRERLEGHA
jgi:RNA polymerase sigma-70 factor (ECF subfamily)